MKNMVCIDCGKPLVDIFRAKRCKSCANKITSSGRVFSKDRKNNITKGKLKRKNGVRKQSAGYVEIYSPNHPNKHKNNGVLEHRLVMENHLERYLHLEERVHHINGIKNDNRIDNLMLFPSEKAHQHFHRRQETHYSRRN